MAPEHAGPVAIESYTVMYDAYSPSVGLAACLTQDGRCMWGNTGDRSVLQAMVSEGFCGRAAALYEGGALTF